MVEILVETKREYEGREYIEYNSIEYCTEEYVTRLLSYIAGKKGAELKKIALGEVHNLNTEVLVERCSIEEYKTIVTWLIAFIDPFITLNVDEVEILNRGLSWDTYEDFYNNILGKK